MPSRSVHVRRVRRVVAVGSAGLLGYTIAGYPMIMAVRARLAPRPVRSADGSSVTPPPKLTILIPAHNEADVIARKLNNLLALDYASDRLELLVVDDGSDDGTARIVERYTDRGVRLLARSPRRGKMSAVNAGVREARGDLVLLTDASATFDSQAVTAAVTPFADPSVGVVSGRIAIRGGGEAVEQPAGLYWRYQERLRAWESASGSTVGVNGNLFVFRRKDYRPLPEDIVNDEFAIAMDAAGRGDRILYAPGAVAYDEASASMSDEVVRRSRINAGRFQALSRTFGSILRRPSMVFRLVSHKALRVLIPLFMLLLAAASLARRPLEGRRDGLVATVERRALEPGQIALYTAAALGAALDRRGIRPPRIVSVAYYFVSSNLAALAGLARFATGGQSVLWRKRAPQDPPA